MENSLLAVFAMYEVNHDTFANVWEEVEEVKGITQCIRIAHFKMPVGLFRGSRVYRVGRVGAKPVIG